jgi:hypothetical protein
MSATNQTNLVGGGPEFAGWGCGQPDPVPTVQDHYQGAVFFGGFFTQTARVVTEAQNATSGCWRFIAR